MTNGANNLYLFLRKIWRKVPSTIRARPVLSAVKESIASVFRVHKQGIYTAAYYRQDVEEAAVNSGHRIVDSICAEFGPGTVADVGCGTGALLAEFAKRGVKVLGLEYSEAGCQISREQGVSVEQFDVRYDELDPGLGQFDVVCCTEVAEHIPERFASALVHKLTMLGSRIVFTAATPGQGGTDHVNEQPHDYWISQFRSHNFFHCEEVSRRWASEWAQHDVSRWYWENLLVFERTGS